MMNLLKIVLLVLGKIWIEPLHDALESVNPDGLDLAAYSKALNLSVQDCHGVPGEIRKYIVKQFSACKTLDALNVKVAELALFLMKNLPA